MDERVLFLIISAVLALINAVIMFKVNRKAKEADEREKILQELEIRVNAQERACALCRISLLTEDKLRTVLQEQFDRFELRLINQGRLRPLTQKDKP